VFNQELYAATVARAIDALRQPDAVEAQKVALRALVTLAAAGSATIRCYDGILSVDDVPIPSSVPNSGSLAARLATHGIAEIAIGRGAKPGELLAMLRALAGGPDGNASVKERLREAGSGRIMILLSDPGARKERDSVGKLFTPVVDATGVPAVPVAPARPSTAADDPLADWNALHASGSTSSTLKEIDLGIVFDDPATAPPAVDAMGAAAADATAAPPPEKPAEEGSDFERAYRAVASRPHEGDVLDRLTALAEHVQEALRTGEIAPALGVLAHLVEFEAGAREGTPKNSYRIVLRRLLTADTLALLAPFTCDPDLGVEAARVFAQSGSIGADLLVKLLAETESRRERRGYMNALRGMPNAGGGIVPMLAHGQWFVARNMAELCAELRLAEAAPELAKLLGHQDQRVRKAAAAALARLGTAGSEPLRMVLYEGSKEMRTLVASLLGEENAALAAPLIARLDEEKEPDVLREVCLALGRIGTADARAALEQARGHGGGLFSRRVKVLKESAEEALRRKSGGGTRAT
jgi:hypothetical protein